MNKLQIIQLTLGILLIIVNTFILGTLWEKRHTKECLVPEVQERRLISLVANDFPGNNIGEKMNNATDIIYKIQDLLPKGYTTKVLLEDGSYK